MDADCSLSPERAPSYIRALYAGVAYFCLAALTLGLTSDGRNHATIWIADAAVLALLLQMPRSQWRPVLVAGLIANHLANDVMRGFAWGHILYAAINIGQTWVAAIFLQRRLATTSILSDMRALGLFVLWAALITPAIGGLLGSLTAMAIYQQPFAPSFARWFSSNALGIVVATPFFNSIWDGSYAEFYREKTALQRWKTFGLLAGYAAMVDLVFRQADMPLLFLPVSALVLLTFPLGRHGIKVGILITAIIGTLATIADRGPIALMHGDLLAKSIFFQFYLIMTLATCLTVVAIITSRAEFSAQLDNRDKSIRMILANSPDAVLGFDAHGCCIFAGGPTEVLLDTPSRDLVGLFLPQLAQKWPELDAFLHGRETVVELQSNQGFCVEASFALLDPIAAGSGAVITFHNITARALRERELAKKVFTDDLTQVLNRAGFHQGVHDVLKEGVTCSLALIDVDHFKDINDRYGHGKGDEVLSRIGQFLRTETRATDLVGRIGGDEFAILFRADATTAAKVCRRILDRCRQLHDLTGGGHPDYVTLSCGIAQMMPGWSKAQLFRTADEALYEVKAQGRNAVRLRV